MRKLAKILSATVLTTGVSFGGVTLCKQYVDSRDKYYKLFELVYDKNNNNLNDDYKHNFFSKYNSSFDPLKVNYLMINNIDDIFTNENKYHSFLPNNITSLSNFSNLKSLTIKNFSTIPKLPDSLESLEIILVKNTLMDMSRIDLRENTHIKRLKIRSYLDYPVALIGDFSNLEYLLLRSDDTINLSGAKNLNKNIIDWY